MLYQELAAHDAPRLVLAFVGIHHAASTLLIAGTEAQRQRHLPAILDGEIWVQGFSEPEAGSDLASLRTTARRTDDGYVVNGQKLWASGGMHADWCLLLARTDPAAPKRKGLSYFLMDMRSPGIDVRPIRNAIGESHFCEIFLNDVVIPAEHLVGGQDGGWQVAQATLGAERGMTMLELAERLRNVRVPPAGRRMRPYADGRFATARRFRGGGPAGPVRHRDRRSARSVPQCGSGSRRGCRRSGGPVDREALLQRAAAAAHRFRDRRHGAFAHTVLTKPTSSGWESGAWAVDFIGSWEWTIPGGSQRDPTHHHRRARSRTAQGTGHRVTSDLHEFHDELRLVARELLSKGGQWEQFVDAAGWGRDSPDSAGGAGASFVETAILLQEIGRAAADTRYLGSALAVGALTASTPTTPGKPSWNASAGRDVDAGDGLHRVAGRGVRSSRVRAGCPRRRRRAAIGRRRREPRRRAGIGVDNHRTARARRDPLAVGRGGRRRRDRRILAADNRSWHGDARAAVAVACDSLGLCEGMLTATVEYATVRQQFGRPIGSFQAVKHACADMLVTVSVARQLIGTAVESLALDGQDGEAVQVAAAMAKSYACAAAVDVVGKAMQLHGGIGYTWESGVHVYLKRALLNRALYGSPHSTDDGWQRGTASARRRRSACAAGPKGNAGTQMGTGAGDSPDGLQATEGTSQRGAGDVPRRDHAGAHASPTVVGRCRWAAEHHDGEGGDAPTDQYSKSHRLDATLRPMPGPLRAREAWPGWHRGCGGRLRRISTAASVPLQALEICGRLGCRHQAGPPRAAGPRERTASPPRFGRHHRCSAYARGRVGSGVDQRARQPWPAAVRPGGRARRPSQPGAHP